MNKDYETGLNRDERLILNLIFSIDLEKRHPKPDFEIIKQYQDMIDKIVKSKRKEFPSTEI